ncbi:MAG: hypothetical protein ACR2JO_06060 [Mycobacteriales bacterium]
MSRAGRRLLLGTAGAATARVIAGTLAGPVGTSPAWQRANYRGEPVSLLGGPAVVLAGAAGVAASWQVPARLRLAAVVAGLGAGAVGRYDDRYGIGTARGFAGHLDALAGGRVSTGIVKIVGIGAGGLAAGALAGRHALDALLAGAVVAGTANLVNLMDLRPGRALKSGLAISLLLVARPEVGGELVAGPLGAVTALLPADLAQRTMLGDAGANGLGALLGVGLIAAASRRRLVVLLLLLVGLTVASEVVSFSAVIDRVRPLRWLDRLGARPLPG